MFFFPEVNDMYGRTLSENLLQHTPPLSTSPLHHLKGLSFKNDRVELVKDRYFETG